MKRSTEKTQFLADVIVTAIEGGTGYWARAYGYTWSEEKPETTHATLVDFEEASDLLGVTGMQWNYAWLDEAVEAKDERIAKVTYNLDIDTVAKAFGRINKGSAAEAAADLKYASEEWVKRMRECYRENDADLDAGDADMVVQIATLGEIVYG